ncbi:hypothetical protein FRB96_006134 [Tulasnella sp. 330]|nr:hypothetical protein FRB96_006134 [Tulasnella sp. 330]
MALNDLMAEIAMDRTLFHGDEPSEVKVLNQVLKLIEDKISEVKNQAVKCLGQLIKVIRENNLTIVVDKLIQFSSGKEEELRDVAGLAFKTVVSELPADGKLAAAVSQKMVPKLLAQLQNSSQPATPPDSIMETLSTLSVLVARFPQQATSAANDPIKVILPLTSHSRAAVRKRAITTLAQYVPYAPPAEFPELMKSTITPSLAASASIEKQQTVSQLVGAVARYAPTRVAPVLGDIIPGLLAAAQREDSDLCEGCLQTLETLTLRCPTEVTPYLPSIMLIAKEMVKYDPNYAADDEDEDEAMGEPDDDDDDDAVDDAYSDDEDTSYKVRRSSAKVILAIINTRPELLTSLYLNVSPVIISRFGDREESVKLELWSTYSHLIKQTGVYGDAPQAKSTEGGKRKRGEGMEVEDTPYTLLKSQVQALSKALLKQLQPKSSAAVLQAGMDLLQSLLVVLPGSLAPQAQSISSITASILGSSSSSTTSSLHATVLSFLSLFFSTHAIAAYKSAIPALTPKMLSASSQRHPRIASEAFRAFSALLIASKPVQAAEWVNKLYDEVVARLRSGDTDAEVRMRAEDVVIELWLNATDIMRTKGGHEWDALLKGGRLEGAVRVVEKVAGDVSMDGAWVGSSTEWIFGVLQRPAKAGKSSAFGCLEVLLQQYKSGVPEHIPAEIVPQLIHFLSLNDLVLMTHALSTLNILLRVSPKQTYPLVEKSVLPTVYQLAHSPSVSGTALEALTEFFQDLVAADNDIAGHIVPGLVLALEKSKTGETSPSNVSKCVSAVVRGYHDLAAGIIAEFAKSIKPRSKSTQQHVVLSLLALGEIGKTIDMANQQEIFSNSLALFSAESETIRAAAAFAAGNIAVGSLHTFLNHLVAQMQSDQEKRLLTLHALKELETVAGALWVPLFAVSSSSEETVRNVAAGCLGQLTTANPTSYLPQLQERLADPSPSVRATVVAAVRYTFADNTQSYDELLSPLIIQFMSLVHDSDLAVRRSTLSTLNAAARNKPHLVRDHLSGLMPLLYKETFQKPELIRIVEMGPWKHRVDDGLEARKTAYETMYTILDTCLAKIDIHEFLSHVITGLRDEANEIKVLCHMMLFRLSQVAPTAVSLRLDDMAADLSVGMKGAPVGKDTVKQDLERTAELQRSTLRAIAALSKISAAGSSSEFDKVVDSVSRPGSQWSSEFHELLRTFPTSIKRSISLTTVAKATITTPDLLSTLDPTPDRVPLSKSIKSARPVRGRLSDTPLPPRPRKEKRPPRAYEVGGRSSGFTKPVVSATLDKYFLHVHASSNNTLLHLMDAQGNCQPKGQVSAGILKYRHKQRSTFDAGFQASLRMIKRIEEEANKKRVVPVRMFVSEGSVAEDGFEETRVADGGEPQYKPGMEVEVVFNGFGHGKQAFIAAMMSSEGDGVRPLVTRFTDRTHIKIGGERSPKARRL